MASGDGAAPKKRAGARGIGRKPGSKNKFTIQAKEAFQLAFKGMGGVPQLVRWAKKNPTEFYKLYSRLIPVEVGGAGKDGAIKIVISGDESAY